MDNTLSQILSYLYQLQAENDSLKRELAIKDHLLSQTLQHAEIVDDAN